MTIRHRLISPRLLIPLIALIFLIPASALAALPDNRAYEMVSPVEKGGLSFIPNLAVAETRGEYAEHVIVDGGSYNSLLANGASWMLETRTPSGWSGVQVGPSPPPEANATEQDKTGLVAVSEDFTRFAFATIMPLDSRISRPSMNIYTREGSGGPLAWVSGPPSPLASVSEPGECENGVAIQTCTTDRAILAGTSADLGTLVWGQYYPLVAPPAVLPGSLPDTHEHGYEVYESAGGADRLIGLVPAASTECGPGGGCVVPACGAAMGNQDGARLSALVGPFESSFATVQGAVSGDGSQAIFTSPDPSTQGTPGCVPPEIYLRENGTTTIEVSASQRANADPSGPQEMKYAGSSEEKAPGSSLATGRINTIFFTSKEELTENANTGGADEGDDLYAYNVATGKLVDITPINNTPGPSGPMVTFLGSSSDGTLVYFTATSVLTAELNGHGESAKPGVSNLYVYDAATGSTTFIANGAGLNGPSIGLGGHVVPTYSEEMTSQVTPDGQHIVFVSSERLTSYDNSGSECQGSPNNGVAEYSPGWCAEVYLYSRSGNSLSCVSCNPSGGPPVGSARLPTVAREGYLMSLLEPGTLPLPRAISDDGNRVFFASPDQLTAEAPAPASTRASQSLANLAEFEPNVYEYEEGDVHLIASAARLLTSTPSGDDVLFDTYAQLVPQDRDGLPDVYDARVNGGFPVLAPPACSGTSCQGAPAPAPIFETPAGVTFNSPTGNFPPPTSPAPPKKTTKKTVKCTKGKKLSHGKCTKAKKKSKRAKKASRDSRSKS